MKTFDCNSQKEVGGGKLSSDTTFDMITTQNVGRCDEHNYVSPLTFDNLSTEVGGALPSVYTCNL